MFIKNLTFKLFLIVIISFSTTLSLCADWPTWRYDAGRAAASPQELAKDLHLQWVIQYAPREMVWDDPLNQDLMPYDKFFEPVVMGNTMFIGFNDSDKVIALNTGTGREIWAFYTDGPVRFPPVAADGKAWFTSDDGFLYCLNAANGKLIWKYRGGPTDRRILGNKRLISTWPARGGPVLVDGTVYFAASIWPMMGTFICALDSHTGEVIWNNDGTGADYILQPHGAPAFAGVAPQGAMVSVGDSLLIPGGRSVPACFDRNNGELRYYHLSAYNKTGGSFACALGDIFFNHHREKVTTMYRMSDGKPILKRIGKHPVLTNDIIYFSGDSITALDSPGTLRALNTKEPPKNEEILKQFTLWNIEADSSGDLIKSGSRLYAAGNGSITAVNLNSSGTGPEIAWKKVVDGQVERLITADDKLFAVTRDGRIMAFGEEKIKPLQILARPVPVESNPAATQKALTIINDTGVNAGYALYYGKGNGGLLRELLNNSQLRIIAVCPDADTVDTLRREFDTFGLYGSRISFHQGDLFSFNTPPYIASLTIIDDPAGNQYKNNFKFIKELYNSMRPYGGKAWLDTGNLAMAKLEITVTGSELSGLNLDSSHRVPILTRDGPIPGAADWSHVYGNIANTAKSDDTLVKLPLGVLWFGGNSNMDVLPRHAHGPPEQVVNGRLFIEGMSCMSARDVYTGRVIWKTDLHDMGTYGIYFNETYKDTPTSTRYNQGHIPGANIRGTNFVATADRVYVIQGSSCYILSAETGDVMDVFSIPKEENKKRRKWGYIGVYKDLLIAGNGFTAFSDLTHDKKEDYSIWTDYDYSAGRGLIVMNRFTGKIIWQFDDVRNGLLHNSIVVGNDTLFCLDKLPTYIEGKLKRRGVQPPGDARLIAMNINNGEIIWENRDNVFGTFMNYSEKHDTLLQATRPSRDMVAGEEGKRMAAFQGKTGNLIWDKELSYRTFPIIHNDNIITEGKNLSLSSGEQLYRHDTITGQDHLLTWNRHYGCNYPIACENLITFRSAAAGFYDLANNGGTGNFGGFKSGCTPNLVAANGVLNAPDYTRTCSCSYQNQTSLALVHMPDVETWTFNILSPEQEKKDKDGKKINPDLLVPIKKLGINFGAPGDRIADNETMWLEYPIVGGPSPKMPININSGNPDWFCHHSSKLNGDDLKWVCASGLENLGTVTVDLGNYDPRYYTIRLFFAETEGAEKGQRVFDLDIQGKTVLQNFDIINEVGPNHTLLREFKGIKADKELVLSAYPSNNNTEYSPLLCGLEILIED